MDIDPVTTAAIHEQLVQIEREENVRVLFACEAGSRAWGFPSADSDYDVRFLYLRPLEWYLSIAPGRDVIERPIDADLDLTGWDLKKALHLLAKSNPPLIEWLRSPTIYWEQGAVAASMRAAIPRFHAPAMSARHYLRMAQRSWSEYTTRAASLKMLFYSLRALLALRWIAEARGAAPTEFICLADALVSDSGLRGTINSLMEIKAGGAEKDRNGDAAPLEQFVQGELARWETDPIPAGGGEGAMDELDAIFRAALRETWDD
jgi:predicted nucleotidyltransferase